MRKQGKYVLGTAGEIAEYIVDESFDFTNKFIIKGDLKFYDFAIADRDVSPNRYTLEEIKMASSSWYGIKQIETGFDFEGINLFADYYGGRCMICGEIDIDYSRDDCCKVVREMMLNVLNIQESCNEDTLIIAEPAE